MLTSYIGIIVPVVLIVLVLVLIVFLGNSFYKKAPPNTAMIITGSGGTKTVVGKASFVIPFFQRVDYMSLQNIQVDFTSKEEIPTQDAINILVDAVANISISTDPERMKIASSKFLGFSTDQIREIVTPVLEGNIREIISQITLKSLIQGDKKQLAEKIAENVTPNLNDMGLELTTFNIQNFKDKNHVIENLGIQNTVQISKDAEISKAHAEAEIAEQQAESRRRANEAQVKADLDIEQKTNELSLKKSELKKIADAKEAEAEAAKGIQAEEQRKTLEIKTAEANLAKQEKAIELQERAVQIQERKLEAEVKKTAEAEKYAKQQAADAQLYEIQRQSEAELFERQKKAEADKFEAQQRAEANKALAEAEKYAKEQQAEAIKAAGLAEAEAIRAKGTAEAEAIKAKALAEAEGKLKIAEAMKEYGEAAKSEQLYEVYKELFRQLPEIAKGVGEGYQSVDKINIYGGDSTRLQSDIINNVTQITEAFTQATGLDIKKLANQYVVKKIDSDDVVEIDE